MPHICPARPRHNKPATRILGQPPRQTFWYCRFKCGTKVVRDEKIAREPKLKEIETGYHHDYQRCGEILTRQRKPVPFHYNKVDKQLLVDIDMQNRLNGDYFDPANQFYPSDLFILVGFDEKGQPLKERNPKYHTQDGEYVKT